VKFLLAQNLVYLPNVGGANKSNRMLLELIHSHGHACLAVTPAHGFHGPRSTDDMLEALDLLQITPVVDDKRNISYRWNGVTVRAVSNPGSLRADFAAQIQEFVPDWIILSSEDTNYTFLAEALQHDPSKVIFLARTTLTLPFGPDSALPDSEGLRRMARVAHIFCVSNFIKNYIARWGNLDSSVVPLSFYGASSFPEYANFEHGYVTMVNPCAVKGLSVFLELAEVMPHMSFAAVPTWGATAADLIALQALRNVTILPASDDIDVIFARTRILVAPSLWAEAKGEIVIEAMLRGIPVLAANVGGLAEAKLGVEYLLPVQKIRQYTREIDDRMVPIPIIPAQNIDPWKRALDILVSDRNYYAKLSRASRAAALRFASNASVDPLLAKISRKSAFTVQQDEVQAASADRWSASV
jgi:glycosyltransferase involved in cell wall biosynthesis